MLIAGVVLVIVGGVAEVAVILMHKVFRIGLLSGDDRAKKRNQLMREEGITQAEADTIINAEQGYRKRCYIASYYLAGFMMVIGGVLIALGN